MIKEGHKSFPSGHSSCTWVTSCDSEKHTGSSFCSCTSSLPGSFAGLGFLSWYLAGKIKAFDRRGHVAKLCIVLLPLLLATMVAISRVDDYWHHWQDVFAGGILGRLIDSAGSPTELYQQLPFLNRDHRLTLPLVCNSQVWWLRPSATCSFFLHRLVNQVRPYDASFAISHTETEYHFFSQKEK